MNNNTPIVRHVLNIYNTYGEQGIKDLLISATAIEQEILARTKVSQPNKKTSKTK